MIRFQAMTLWNWRMCVLEFGRPGHEAARLRIPVLRTLKFNLSRRRFYTSCYNAGRIHQKLMLCLIWNIHGNTLSKRCVLPLAHFYSFTRFGRKRFLLILRMTPWPRRLWRSKRYLSGKQDLIEYNINKWKILNRQFSGGRIWAMRQGVRYLDKISIHQM